MLRPVSHAENLLTECPVVVDLTRTDTRRVGDMDVDTRPVVRAQ